jgi:hypothetical protein
VFNSVFLLRIGPGARKCGGGGPKRIPNDGSDLGGLDGVARETDQGLSGRRLGVRVWKVKGHPTGPKNVGDERSDRDRDHPEV